MDVNIMPASVYKLVCKDPDLKKLSPSALEIGTYTKDTVKLLDLVYFIWFTWILRNYMK